MNKGVNVERVIDLPSEVDGDIILHVPMELRRGWLRNDERASIGSALITLRRISELTGLHDWSELRVLDFGCGVKFTQALVQYNVPVGSYVGMDVFDDMICYLRAHVRKPGFAYYTVPFQNDMYQPNGIPIRPDSVLPGSIRFYDLFTLQSVFTHFTPVDFQNLLHVLRRHAGRGARLFFTCVINDAMEADFLDSVPDRPLFTAMYREAFVRRMLAASAWDVLSVHPPGYEMASQFVCVAA